MRSLNTTLKETTLTSLYETILDVDKNIKDSNEYAKNAEKARQLFVTILPKLLIPGMEYDEPGKPSQSGQYTFNFREPKDANFNTIPVNVDSSKFYIDLCTEIEPTLKEIDRLLGISPKEILKSPKNKREDVYILNNRNEDATQIYVEYIIQNPRSRNFTRRLVVGVGDLFKPQFEEWLSKQKLHKQWWSK